MENSVKKNGDATSDYAGSNPTSFGPSTLPNTLGMVRGQKLWVHAVKDLASRYQLEPLTALASSGIEVARHLESLFRSQGAPLLLKTR